MIKLILLLSFLVSVTGHTYSQVKQPANRIFLQMGPQYNLKKGHILSDGKGPQPISARNTAGGYIGLGYERVTRKGLILSYDVQFLSEPHDVTTTYDFKGFDPEGSIVLDKADPFVRNFRTTLIYFNQRLMVGKEFAVGKPVNGLVIQAKAGLRFTTRRNRIYNTNEEERLVGYQTNASLDSSVAVYKIRVFTRIYSNLDAGGGQPMHQYRGFGPAGYDLYLGLLQQTDKRWLSSVSLGLEFAHGFEGGGIDVQAYSYDPNGNQIGVDKYNPRRLALGLRVGLNFWK